MNVYLVQHGEAKSEKEDPQKSLSEQGWTDVRKAGAFLVEYAHIKVASIMHSGKTRARQTAEALAEYLTPPKGIKKADGLNPLDDTSIWIERLSETKEDIMLVGHLPHLCKLSAELLAQDENKKVIEFQRGGILCLGKDESGLWSVHWMIIPQILK
jgi:phosphohistidine phosphatase